MTSNDTCRVRKLLALATLDVVANCAGLFPANDTATLGGNCHHFHLGSVHRTKRCSAVVRALVVQFAPETPLVAARALVHCTDLVFVLQHSFRLRSNTREAALAVDLTGQPDPHKGYALVTVKWGLSHSQAIMRRRIETLR